MHHHNIMMLCRHCGTALPLPMLAGSNLYTETARYRQPDDCYLSLLRELA